MVTTDSPGMDCDLICFIPIVPPITCSIGLETNVSTKSDEKPGDSVWMTTCVGENSGNTFNGLKRIWYIP